MDKIDSNTGQSFSAAGTKVAIFGAGAIGMTFGGFLARNGIDVTLIARPRYVEAINRQGLVIQSKIETVTTYPRAAEKLDFRPDLLLLAVKAQHTLEAADQFKSFTQDVPIISLQNGVRNIDLLAEVSDKRNIIGSVVAFDARIDEPGRVMFAIRNPDFITLGDAFQKNGARLESIRNLLSKNGAVDVHTSDDIRAALWSKLVANSGANPLMTLTDLGIEELMGYAKIRTTIVRLLKEGFAVCHKAGIAPEPLPGMSSLRIITTLPTPLASLLMAAAKRKLKGHDVGREERFSKDLKRGKTEIDYLNGEIVALSKKIGCPAPTHEKIVNLTHRMEKAGHTMSLAELLENL